MSGSISQMTIRSTLGCRTNDPAVTPAPKPTISTVRAGVHQGRDMAEQPLQPHVVRLGRGFHLAATWKFANVSQLDDGNGGVHAFAHIEMASL